jgi:hypothetical protein
MASGFHYDHRHVLAVWATVHAADRLAGTPDVAQCTTRPRAFPCVEDHEDSGCKIVTPLLAFLAVPIQGSRDAPTPGDRPNALGSETERSKDPRVSTVTLGLHNRAAIFHHDSIPTRTSGKSLLFPMTETSFVQIGEQLNSMGSL